MVLGVQIVPAHAPSTAITRYSDLQDAFQTHRVRPRALLVAVQPSLTRYPYGRHPLRFTPRPHPTLRTRNVLHVLRRYRRLHDRRRDVPLRNTRRPRTPATARHALARTLRAPLDVHLDHGFLELPLAPILPEHLRHIWCASRRCAPRKAGCAIRRLWRIRIDALCWVVGSREGNGVQQRKFLPSDGRRRCAGTCLVARDWQAGAGFLGLGVDDDLDACLGYVYVGWVGTTRHDCVRLFHAWATTGETDRRCYHFSHDAH
jgi:hypothetical protein